MTWNEIFTSEVYWQGFASGIGLCLVVGILNRTVSERLKDRKERKDYIESLAPEHVAELNAFLKTNTDWRLFRELHRYKH